MFARALRLAVGRWSTRPIRIRHARSSTEGTSRVDPDASAGEIRQAFRKLAVEAHPDKPGGVAGEFITLRGAYELLSDASRRAAYDEQCASAEAALLEQPAVSVLDAAAFEAKVEARRSGEQPVELQADACGGGPPYRQLLRRLP